jgi:hypothetical protein
MLEIVERKACFAPCISCPKWDPVMFVGVELLWHSADHGPQGGDHPLTEAICGLLRRPGQYYNQCCGSETKVSDPDPA